MSCNNINPWLPYFTGFSAYTPSVPKLYWNVKSQEQRILELCKQLHKLICYIDCVADHVNINHDDIEELEEQFEKFIESGFDDYYRESINAWIADHMPEIIGKYINTVFFGLTLDGYFVAYIPDGSGWDDIIFDTGAVYDSDTYGRLILSYATDTSSDVWQESTIRSDLEQAITDLQATDVTFASRLNALDDLIYNPIMESDL